VTGCRSDRTVGKYLKYLEEAFLFFSVPRFSYKVKTQVSANKKIYCIDNGFVTAKGFRFSENRGSLFENLVAVSLRQRELRGELNLFYWKNTQQEEVDFVVQRNGRVTELIQVCTDIRNEKTLRREVHALLKAGHDTNCKRLLVLSMDEERESREEWFGIRGIIRFIPLWKWLLLRK
jgi:hypothetical protein